jgi:hypothetical protein
MELFFWLVKIQSRWPLVPRVSFAPLKAKRETRET